MIYVVTDEVRRWWWPVQQSNMPVAEIASFAGLDQRSLRMAATLRAGGERALASKGQGGSACRLDTQRLDGLAGALEQGAAVHEFGADQRWTLARVADLITCMFHACCTCGVLLHRKGSLHRSGASGH